MVNILLSALTAINFTLAADAGGPSIQPLSANEQVNQPLEQQQLLQQQQSPQQQPPQQQPPQNQQQQAPQHPPVYFNPSNSEGSGFTPYDASYVSSLNGQLPPYSPGFPLVDQGYLVPVWMDENEKLPNDHQYQWVDPNNGAVWGQQYVNFVTAPNGVSQEAVPGQAAQPVQAAQ